jgi:hypothetical protein
MNCKITTIPGYDGLLLDELRVGLVSTVAGIKKSAGGGFE